VNQVQCTINPEHQWSTNGPESNLYGLEPNYGCCTSNMHQGWPKFTSHLWMRTPDDGLACAAWAPCRVDARIRDLPVSLRVDTDYPFREDIALTVTTERAARFPLLLRVPAWAEGATVRVGGGQYRMDAGSLFRLERDWSGDTEVRLHFPMHALVTRRYNEAVAVERGPLVYSLRIAEDWTRVNADKPHREPPHADWEVRPASPWNYALVLDRDAPESGIRFEERPVGERPFSPDGAGVVAHARGRQLPNWRILRGWAGEISPADVAWADPPRSVSGEADTDIEMIPYGCTNIRITEFPGAAASD
jgi:hypothetical protein